MWSDKMEKRIASSIFITLAPPRRDHLAKGQVRPAGAPHLPCNNLPKEALRIAGPIPPQVSTRVTKGGGRGHSPEATGIPNGGCSVVPPPSVLPSCRVDSDLNLLFPPPPPPEFPPAPFSVETLGPDLEKQVEVLQQLPPSTFPAEVRQTRTLPSNLSRAGEQQTERQVEAAISTGVCAFCHKGLSPRAPAIEAMNKQCHAGCFTCRTCRRALAGQRFYRKEGRPLCVGCYKNTLEKCARCQAQILNHIVHAMGHKYHPECFTCVVCGRSLGDETFAVGEEAAVHCLPDFYRKYASVCCTCEEPIIPSQGRDSYKIECLGRHFHEDCYRSVGSCYPRNPRRVAATLWAIVSFATPATSSRKKSSPAERTGAMQASLGAAVADVAARTGGTRREEGGFFGFCHPASPSPIVLSSEPLHAFLFGA